MYGDSPVAPVAPVVAGVAVSQLPNTGNDMLIQLAVAVVAGLLVWGVMYALKARKNVAVAA
jgi:LPXTG-motif cell wall-anchored protein